MIENGNIKVKDNEVVECFNNNYDDNCIFCIYYDKCELKYHKEKNSKQIRVWGAIAIIGLMIWTLVSYWLFG